MWMLNNATAALHGQLMDRDLLLELEMKQRWEAW